MLPFFHGTSSTWFVSLSVLWDVCLRGGADVQCLGKSVSSGQVPGPFGMTLEQAEKVGHRAFWELRSLVARSLSSLKKIIHLIIYL